MKKFVTAAGISLLIASASVFGAVPSLSQVEHSIGQRNWQRADTQLSQVIDAHPNNARARYLYGQVLDREGRSAEALTQIERAKSIDPTLRFTNPSMFAQTEARVRADANRSDTAAPAGDALQPAQTQLAPMTPARHEPSTGMWIGLALLVIVIAFVLRWTLRRARSSNDEHANDARRAQLKRATDLLNAARPLKLDARLSTASDATALAAEVERVENDARALVEKLSDGKNPVPPYLLDELERRFASLQARIDGRADPSTAPTAPANGSESVFAQEADRLAGSQSHPSYPPPQPPVVVQQGGGGFSSGMGGLLTGVLLGEAMAGGRERVIERDVLVDDERRRPLDDALGNSDPGFDIGQGDGWDTGGGIDLGSSDDWSNN